MELREPWLTCRMGKKLCLLAKDDTAYYIIEVGKRLDYETEEWLMQQGVSEALLKELQLSFTYIPKPALRGIAVSGHDAGEVVYLYLKSEKIKLMLELDYDREWMDDFFQGIPRFSAPKKKKQGDPGWRKEKQDPELFKKLLYVPAVFWVLGTAAAIGYVTTGYRIFYTLCLIIIAAQVSLAVSMPVYFTICLPKGGKKQNVYELDLSLVTMLLILLVCRSHYEWLYFEALWISIPAGLIIGIIIYWRVKDLHKIKAGWLTTLFMCICICIILTGQINVVYAPLPPESHVLEVEDLHSSGGRRSNCYCTVTMPDGEELKIRIPRSLYRELDEGDYVYVEHGTGLFGIEYSSVTAKAE